MVVLQQRDRLHRRRVGQAEEHQVGRVEELFPLLRVLALVLVDEQQLDVVPLPQALVNLEAGGALLAVDVDFRPHPFRASTNASMLAICCSTASLEGPP